MRTRVLLACCLALGCKPAPSPPVGPTVSQTPERTEPPSPLRTPTQWLEALGLTLAGGPLPIAHVSEAEAAAELGRRNDALWPEDRVLHIVGLMWLMLGDGTLGVDIEVVRQGMRQGATKPALAYYGRDRIALIDKEATALAPAPLILTHELVHAYQDEQLSAGVFETLAGARTIDELAALQLTLEGHAEFVSMAAFVAGHDASPQALTPAFFDPGFARIANPSASLLYERGALAMLHAFEGGGLDAVDALLRAPPTTSEQMLHPSKRGADLPTPIEVPQIPGATAALSTSIGELTIRNLLSSRIIDERTLALATTGWDGDRITWYETEAGPMLVWRTVWDREQDVDQFVEAWEALGGERPAASCSIADERRLDFVALPPSRTEAEAMAIAEALPVPALPASDGAASTAAAERALLEELSARIVVETGVVTFRDSGVRIPIPPQWNVLTARGVPFLRGPIEGGFGDNVVVTTSPNLLGFTLDEVARETLAQLRDVLGNQIVGQQRRSVAGREAWVVESIGHEAGSPIELRQLRVVFFTDSHRVVLTFTAHPDRWPTVGPRFRDMIDRLEPAR